MLKFHKIDKGQQYYFSSAVKRGCNWFLIFRIDCKNPPLVYSYFEKGCRKNVHATIPKGNMGYDQYTVPDTVAVEPTFVAFL